MKKQMFSLLLAGALLLSAVGCTQKPQNTQSNIETQSSTVTESPPPTEPLSENTGRYVETEIALPADSFLSNLFYFDGAPACLDKGRVALCVRQENADRCYLRSLRKSEYLNDIGYVSDCACAPDGSYLLYYYNSTTQKNAYLYVNAAGERFEPSLHGEDADVAFLSFAFSSDNRLFAIDLLNNVYEIDPVTATARKLFTSTEYALTFDVIGERIIIVTADGVTLYRYPDGQKEDTPKALQDFILDQQIGLGDGMLADCDFCAGEGDSLYFANESGIFRYVMGGNVVEQLLDGLYYRMGSVAYTVNSVLQDTDGSLLVLYNENCLIRYAFDRSVPDEAATALNIYSLTDSALLRHIISTYKTKNPSVDITYEVGVKNPETDSYADAVAALEQKLASEQSPDVLFLDGLNQTEIVASGKLLELSDVVDADGLLENVACWNKTETGLYSVASRFELPVLIGTEESLQGIDSLPAFADKTAQMHQTHPDDAMFNILLPEEILESALGYTGDTLYSPSGVKKDALIGLLESCKKLYDANAAATMRTDPMDYRSMKKTYNPITFQATVQGQMVAQQYVSFGIGTVGTIADGLCRLQSYATADPPVRYRFGLSENDHSFLPIGNLAICANGENRDNAVAFLQTALSENCQRVDNYLGFAVNNAARKAAMDGGEMKSDYVMSITLADGSEAEIALRSYLPADDQTTFEATLAALNTPLAADAVTKHAIFDVGTACLEGKQSVEDAAAEILRQLEGGDDE